MADDDLAGVGETFHESDLHFAAQDGDIFRVLQLLAEGRSPNTFDEISKTPLRYAAGNGHIEIMRVLLEAGADVNAIDEARIGNTPFVTLPTSVRLPSLSSSSIRAPTLRCLAGCTLPPFIRPRAVRTRRGGECTRC